MVPNKRSNALSHITGRLYSFWLNELLFGVNMSAETKNCADPALAAHPILAQLRPAPDFFDMLVGVLRDIGHDFGGGLERSERHLLLAEPANCRAQLSALRLLLRIEDLSHVANRLRNLYFGIANG